jgi:hypothetical protein
MQEEQSKEELKNLFRLFFSKDPANVELAMSMGVKPLKAYWDMQFSKPQRVKKAKGSARIKLTYYFRKERYKYLAKFYVKNRTVSVLIIFDGKALRKQYLEVRSEAHMTSSRDYKNYDQWLCGHIGCNATQIGKLRHGISGKVTYFVPLSNAPIKDIIILD